MMDRTDRHFRCLIRLLSRHTLLYSEMVSAAAVLHGDHHRLLAFSPRERPLVLQLGGDQPRQLARAARIAADLGYDEVNLNVGCPSPRVQRGNFGACLMREPQLVADCVAEMRAAAALPVTVKHRIGVDEQRHYDDLARFVELVAPSGCDAFIVHARIALLAGLSPKENRTVPPLRHGEVQRLKREHPLLTIEINGGITTLDEVAQQLDAGLDGVMVGRAALERPFVFGAADQRFFGDRRRPVSRGEMIEQLVAYARDQRASGASRHELVRCALALVAGRPGARAWRRALTSAAAAGREPDVLLASAAAQLPREVLDERAEAGCGLSSDRDSQ